MKKRTGLAIALIVAVSSLTVGCAGFDRSIKSMQSNFGNGLTREAKVYDQQGHLLADYIGQFDIQENDAGTKVLFDLNGKRHIIYNGTVIVDEK